MSTLPHDEIADPIQRFLRLQADARASEPLDATAVVLATADAQGRPNARTVLLKGADERGFVFFTNYESTKARELADNPQATLCFHWASKEQQVRVQGTVRPVQAQESDAYFASRPRGSQIGAWASSQSATLESRQQLEQRVQAIESRFEGKPVERPPHWGGFRLRPERIELWFGRPDRLHDRVVYETSGDGWSSHRLYP